MSEKNRMDRSADMNMKTQANREKKMRVRVIAIVIAVMIIALIGVGAGYYFGNKSNGKPATESSNGIEVTSVEAEPVVGATEKVPDDVFTQELNGENDAGLAELAGENVYEDSAAALKGEGNFESADEETVQTDDTVVAEFKGGKIYRSEAAEEYSNLLAVYLFAGYSEEDVSQQLIGETLENLVTQRVMESHAKEMGLTELSDEDRTAAEKTAKEEFEQAVNYMMPYVREEGMSDEDAQLAAQKSLEENDGITYETLYEQTVASAWEEKLYNEVTKDVSISEEDVRSAYNDELAIQESSFTESNENYELAQASGDVIVYNPEGYRAIKMINIYLDDDVLMYKMEMDDLIASSENGANAETIAEMQENVENCYREYEALGQQALDELKSGTDFETVFEKYSGDVEYTPDILRKTGYFVSANSVLYDESIIDTAMGIANPGDLSEVIRTENGICIVQYIKELQPGAVDYESVHDDLQQQTLEEAKENAYNERCAAWVEEVSPVYYEDRMY